VEAEAQSEQEQALYMRTASKMVSPVEEAGRVM
jgi:hypothetical protein